MVATPAGIVKKGEQMFMNSVFINGQQLKRKSYSFKMYCPNCGRFSRVTNTGLPCQTCGSKTIVPASGWAPPLHVMPGKKAKHE